MPSASLVIWGVIPSLKHCRGLPWRLLSCTLQFPMVISEVVDNLLNLILGEHTMAVQFIRVAPNRFSQFLDYKTLCLLLSRPCASQGVTTRRTPFKLLAGVSTFRLLKASSFFLFCYDLASKYSLKMQCYMTISRYHGICKTFHGLPCQILVRYWWFYRLHGQARRLWSHTIIFGHVFVLCKMKNEL